MSKVYLSYRSTDVIDHSLINNYSRVIRLLLSDSAITISVHGESCSGITLHVNDSLLIQIYLQLGTAQEEKKEDGDDAGKNLLFLSAFFSCIKNHFKCSYD